MPDANLRIILSAVDKASGPLKSFKGNLTQLSQAVPGLSGAMSLLTNPVTLATAGITALGSVLKSSVQETYDYALQVKDLSRNLGVNAEEASKLIQVADDLRVDIGALEMGFRTALSKGIVPSIDGLIELSAEYQKLPTAADKARFAIDKFGSRAGLQMQKILEKTPQQLREMSAALEDSALVMSEESVKAAEEYYAAMDQLGETSEKLKYTLGNKLIPPLTDLVVLFNDLSTATDDAAESQNAFESGANKSASILVNGSDAAAKFINSFFLGKKPVDDLTGSLDANTEAVDGNSAAMQYAAYSITELTKAAFAKDAIDGLNASIKAGTIEQEDYEKMLRQLLSGWLELPPTTVEATIALGQLNAADSAASATALEHAYNVMALYNNLKNLDGTTANTTITTSYVTMGAPPTTQSGYRRRAAGGPVMGGYPYIVGERGPELFVPSTGGQVVNNSTTNRIINNSAQSFDYRKLARVLRDELLKVM